MEIEELKNPRKLIINHKCYGKSMFDKVYKEFNEYRKINEIQLMLQETDIKKESK